MLFAAESELEGLAALIREAGSPEVESRPLGAALAGLRRPAGLFGERRRTRRPATAVRLQLFALAILAAGFLLVRQTADREEARAGRLQAAHEALEGRVGRATPLEREAGKLEEALRALQARRPVDPYRALAGLQAVLPAEVRIRSFLLERNAFQVEAVALDPLRLMEAFRRSGVFDEVRMVQVVPLKDEAGELFRLTGRLRAGGGQP